VIFLPKIVSWLKRRREVALIMAPDTRNWKL